MSKPIFLPYQTALMTAVRDHPVTVVEKSRRTGISWAASFIADLTAAAAKESGAWMSFTLAIIWKWHGNSLITVPSMQGSCTKSQ
ncbi:hypothetical protein GT348_07115 [Aristophania vespae]|uniref:Uncharacterized protein n=1 Tax=Aristophania vespae TaxID=2697033 RepID=A0A6P1NFF7_9PROT|nr:hypothetical protein [Aristophania vespae]QHI96033.1 hypothetical protein GT348_07115 [Aristophania vespae]